MLFCHGLGYYSADGEASKAAVFLGLDFYREFESISLQQRVHCEPDFLGRMILNALVSKATALRDRLLAP